MPSGGEIRRLYAQILGGKNVCFGGKQSKLCAKLAICLIFRQRFAVWGHRMADPNQAASPSSPVEFSASASMPAQITLKPPASWAICKATKESSGDERFHPG